MTVPVRCAGYTLIFTVASILLFGVLFAVLQQAGRLIFDLLPLALLIGGQTRCILIPELDQEFVCDLIALLLGHDTGIHAPAIP